VNREEALREILRRAHREHGTCVLALRRIEREIAELRRYVDKYIGGQTHACYLHGVAHTLEAMEEALFEIFKVKPDDHTPSWSRPSLLEEIASLHLDGQGS